MHEKQATTGMQRHDDDEEGKKDGGRDKRGTDGNGTETARAGRYTRPAVEAPNRIDDTRTNKRTDTSAVDSCEYDTTQR